MGGRSPPGSCPSRTPSSLGACLGESFAAHACPFAEPEPVRGARLDVGVTEAHSEEGGGDPSRGLLSHPAAAPGEAGQVSGHSAGGRPGGVQRAAPRHRRGWGGQGGSRDPRSARRVPFRSPGRSGRPTFFTAVFNTFTPAIKESWLNSLQMAKLALGKTGRPQLGGRV